MDPCDLPDEMDEFLLPVIHPFPSSLLDYLPSESLVVFYDRELLKSAAEEIEEQAVHLREESIQEGLLAADFPVPYLTWSELEESLLSKVSLDLGFSAEGEPPAISTGFHQSAPVRRAVETPG